MGSPNFVTIMGHEENLFERTRQFCRLKCAAFRDEELPNGMTQRIIFTVQTTLSEVERNMRKIFPEGEVDWQVHQPFMVDNF